MGGVGCACNQPAQTPPHEQVTAAKLALPENGISFQVRGNSRTAKVLAEWSDETVVRRSSVLRSSHHW